MLKPKFARYNYRLTPSPTADDTDTNLKEKKVYFQSIWNRNQVVGPNPTAYKGPNEDLLL